jgi:raffinose/stachyose/melibiose transport system substrate-binding protein
MGVYYNKEVFAKAGITSTPKNWADMIADAKKIKAAGVTPFYEAAADQWPTQWWVQVQLADAAKAGLWTKVNTGKETFTDPTILGAIKNYDSLIKDGLFNPNIKTATFVDQGKAMLANQTGMVIQINAYLDELQTTASAAQLNKQVGFFPISPSGNVATSIPDQTNSVVAFNTGNTKQEAASRQFMEYWLGDGYKAFLKADTTVSLESAVPSPSNVPEALIQVQKSLAGSVGSMQSLAVANPDLYINLADMVQGTKTPEQVAQTTQQQFDQLAKAQGVKVF